jgi:hypothetical protein
VQNVSEVAREVMDFARETASHIDWANATGGAIVTAVIGAALRWLARGQGKAEKAKAAAAIVEIGKAAVEAEKPAERSPAMKAFLRSIKSDVTTYDPKKMELVAPGIVVTFRHNNLEAVWEILTEANNKLSSLLPGHEFGQEWADACAAAVCRRDEVVERDRAKANEDTALAIGFAHRAAITQPEQAPPAFRKGDRRAWPAAGGGYVALIFDGSQWMPETVQAQPRKAA